MADKINPRIETLTLAIADIAKGDFKPMDLVPLLESPVQDPSKPLDLEVAYITYHVAISKLESLSQEEKEHLGNNIPKTLRNQSKSSRGVLIGKVSLCSFTAYLLHLKNVQAANQAKSKAGK